MLTPKQYELLLFIDGYTVEHGVSPTFDEMRDELHLKSKSGIHRIVSSLEERGFILRLSNRARAIEVLRLPKNSPIDRRPSQNQKIMASGNYRKPGQLNEAVTSIMLKGRIAAGLPREAIESHNIDIEVPSTLLGKGEHYALEIEGDSMQNAGILEGDTAIIEHCETASPGDIVVALIDDEEAMLKIFKRHKATVILESANPAYPPKNYGVDRVRIQGKLSGIIRKY